MVGGSAGPGVARSQHTRECFTGGVQVGEQRMEPEPSLPCRCRQFFVGVRSDEGGVDIDHVEPRVHARCPRRGSGRGTRRVDPFQGDLVDRGEGSPHRRVRRHRAEQFWLIAQRGEIRDRLSATGDRHDQIGQDLTPIMASAALLGRGHRHRQPRSQPNGVSQIGQQASASMVGHASAVTRDLQCRATLSTIHHGSALRVRMTWPSTSTSFPHQKGTSM